MATYRTAGEPIRQKVNQYQDDPIQNRSLSDMCWNGIHCNHRNSIGDIVGCSGWKDRCKKCVEIQCRAKCPCACHERCECLCHADPGKERIVKDRHASESIIEKHGTVEIAGKQCDFKSRKDVQCKAMAAKDSTKCLLHGFVQTSRD
ncbi:MAG TPA: hypothetical protein VHV32_19240 [Candidatus Angelobacter sp.]|jgi:hypothetical protein|nr:hypothetical protein [Candidatus Angelobacter sp.]